MSAFDEQVLRALDAQQKLREERLLVEAGDERLIWTGKPQKTSTV